MFRTEALFRLQSSTTQLAHGDHALHCQCCWRTKPRTNKTLTATCLVTKLLLTAFLLWIRKHPCVKFTSNLEPKVSFSRLMQLIKVTYFKWNERRASSLNTSSCAVSFQVKCVLLKKNKYSTLHKTKVSFSSLRGSQYTENDFGVAQP